MTSNYDRLGERLAAIGAATIRVIVAAPMAAIMGPLPTAAWRYNVRWWGAAGHDHEAQAMRWQAGYVADRPDFGAETVTFRRVAP